MTFLERLRGYMDQGMSASKEFVSKAGTKAHDLGEKGVLKLEIVQLEGQAHKLIVKLGSEVFDAFVERDQKTLSKDSPAIKGLLAEISSLKAAIEKREKELKESSR